MAIDKIQSESINLADNFAFTGTVTGTPGITVADQWRQVSQVTVSSQTLTLLANGNVSRVSGNGQGTFGSAMSESSGVWTFPSTGIWWVRMNLILLAQSSYSRYNGGSIYATTDNSSYNEITTQYTATQWVSSNWYVSTQQDSLLDVTDTSNVKVKFYAYSDNNTVTEQASTRNRTYFTFFRIGDT